MSDRPIVPIRYVIAPSTESKLFELVNLAMAETQKISQLIPAQEDQLVDYRKKWRNLAFPTDTSSEAAIQGSVAKAYNCLNFPTPEIHVFESLFDIPDSFWSSSCWHNPGNVVSLHNKLLQPLIATVTRQVAGQLWGKLWNISPRLEYTPLYPKGWSQDIWAKMQIDAFFKSPYGLRHCGRIDFCQWTLGCTLDVDAWDALYGLVQLGGWLFPQEHLCIVAQKRLINPLRSPWGVENKALVDGLTQPESQILAGLQLAALESVAGRPKRAFERWVNTVSIAQERLSGIAQDRTFLAIIQQAKPITTYTDMDEYPFIDGARSPLASDVWDKCQQIIQLIETPELQIQAQAILRDR
ncbi:MAG: hypothetical protein AAFY26_24730 [Cyanobacteria bacterium J06638_22]